MGWWSDSKLFLSIWGNATLFIFTNISYATLSKLKYFVNYALQYLIANVYL